MEEERRFAVPKSEWGPGPWQDEPDRVEFEHAGLPCLAVRNHYGAWCGYAAVPPGHPLHGQRYQSDAVQNLDAHQGVNYANACSGHLCHTPAPGEPDDVWWFGFDCGHYPYDWPPADNELVPLSCRPVYRDLAYVTREIKKLADQLANVK